MRRRCPRCGRALDVAELTVCRCGLVLRAQHQPGEPMEVRAMQNQTLINLRAAVAPWWRRWSRRQAEARAQLAHLSASELNELRQQAAQEYWSPGRRVDSLVWRVIDAEVQARKAPQ